MERNKKIEKINAYHKLQELTLKAVTKDEDIQKQVQEEFQTWVNLRLADLMGEGPGSSAAGLSAQEVAFLKKFIQKLELRDRVTLTPAPQNQAPKSPAAINRPTGQVRPQRPAVTAREAQRYANNPDAYAQALDAMDGGYDPDAPIEDPINQGRR